MPRPSRKRKVFHQYGRVAKRQKTYAARVRKIYKKRAWTRSTRPLSVRRKRYPVRRKRQSAFARALAAIPPVRWTHQTSLTTQHNMLTNKQNVLQPCTLNSIEDLQQIFNVHQVTQNRPGQRVYIYSSYAEMKVTNFSVTDMHMIMYRITPKRGVNSPAQPNPYTMWQASYNAFDEGTVVTPIAADDPPEQYGAVPDNVSFLKDAYRFKRVMEFDMSTNATKTIRVSAQKKPFFVTYPDLQTSNVGSTKHQVWYMFIGYTSPLVSESQAGHSNGITTVSSGKFGVMVKESYTSKSIQHTPALNIQTNSIPLATGQLRFAADAVDEIRMQDVA